MKSKEYGLPILIVISVGLSFLHSPLFEIFFDDKEFFKYFGLAISKGQTPYKDFFDHKPPLIYFINYAALLMGNWGLWFIDTSLVLYTTIIFYNLCKKLNFSNAFVLPLLLNLLIRNSVISFGIGMTREYTALFTVLFFCFSFTTLQYKYLLLGILAGLTFFTQQDQILMLTPIYIYTLFAEKKSITAYLLKILESLLGFILIALPILFFFFYRNAISYFIEDSFLFNFKWYASKQNIFTVISTVRNHLYISNLEMIFYVVLVLGIAAFKIKGKNGLLITTALTLLFSLTSYYLSGMAKEIQLFYYLLPVSVGMILFLFAANVKAINLLPEKFTLLLSAILLISPAISMVRHGFNLSYKKEQENARRKEFYFLYNQVTLKDFELYTAFDHSAPCLYNDFKILAPSKWIYQFFWQWFPAWDIDAYKIQSIEKELLKHNTTYILDYSHLHSEFKDNGWYISWQNFLTLHYTKLVVQGNNNGGKIWKKKY